MFRRLRQFAEWCAIDELRAKAADKRGGGRTESLEAKQEATEGGYDVPSPDLPSGTDGPDDAHVRLYCLLRDLDEKTRRLLLGHYFDEKTSQQLADENSMKAVTVRVYIHRGLDQLRKRWRSLPNC